MKIKVLLIVIILVFSTKSLFSQKIALQKVKISDNEFKSIFGALKTNQNIVFCLLGNGFLRAENSENTDSLINISQILDNENYAKTNKLGVWSK